MFGRHGKALDAEITALFSGVVIKNAVAIVFDYVVV